MQCCFELKVDAPEDFPGTFFFVETYANGTCLYLHHHLFASSTGVLMVLINLLCQPGSKCIRVLEHIRKEIHIASLQKFWLDE